jgi:hypothetical protein
MARRFVCGFLVALCGCAAFGTAGAGAATEIGSTCEPGAGTSAPLALQLSQTTPPSALETTSAGVVTAWKVRTTSFFGPQTFALKVLRQVGVEYESVGLSAPQAIVGGQSYRFETKIPVAAGVRFGLSSSNQIPLCSSSENIFGVFASDPPIGAKAPLANSTDALIPLAVVVEPDADGDGNGDETQDQCPQSAATQGACPAPPPVGVGAAAKLKGKPKLEGNVVAVKLTTSASTKVTVIGSIRGKRAASAASKTVSPGETGRFYLQLSKATKRRLANLPRKRKLRMVIEAKVAGAPTVSTEISLPGRKKPQPSRAPR